MQAKAAFLAIAGMAVLAGKAGASPVETQVEYITATTIADGFTSTISAETQRNVPLFNKPGYVLLGVNWKLDTFTRAFGNTDADAKISVAGNLLFSTQFSNPTSWTYTDSPFAGESDGLVGSLALEDYIYKGFGSPSTFLVSILVTGSCPEGPSGANCVDSVVANFSQGLQLTYSFTLADLPLPSTAYLFGAGLLLFGLHAVSKYNHRRQPI